MFKKDDMRKNLMKSRVILKEKDMNLNLRHVKSTYKKHNVDYKKNTWKLQLT